MNQTLRTNLLLIGLGLVIALSLIIPTVFYKPPLTPMETILAFHDSIKKGDAADSLLTFDIRAEFESGTVPLYAGSFGDFIKDYQDKYKIIQPINEKIKGNTATVKVDVTYRDNSSETKEFILLKEEGKWKIAELGSVLE